MTCGERLVAAPNRVITGKRTAADGSAMTLIGVPARH
jgi:hypothetical protein